MSFRLPTGVIARGAVSLAVPALLMTMAAMPVTSASAAEVSLAQSAPSRGESPQPPPLLPDMTPLRAAGLYVSTQSGARKLRFEAGLANIGPGPMEVRPNDVKPCPNTKRHASQIIYRDVDGNGHFQRSVDTTFTKKSAGCMLYHPAHNHWHFQAAAKYKLFRPGEEASLVASARKMSFCLRDSRRVPATLGTYHHPLFYAECGRNTPQGISTGWADIYGSYLPGQGLILPKRIRHGVFCLGIRVDPLNRLWESDETNNESVKAFRLRHGTSIEPVAKNRVCVSD